MEAIIKGTLAGLAYGLLLGPLFFVSLKVTLSQGWRNGIALIGGAFASDATLVAGGWWSAARLSTFARLEAFQSSMGLVSGLVLFGFGLSAIWPRKRKMLMEDADEPLAKRRYSFLKGFFINMANPSNWLFWLSLATLVQTEAFPSEGRYAEVFLIATLAVVLLTDLVKVLLAHRIGKYLKPGVPEKIVRVAGLILLAVSGWLLLNVIKNAIA
ncbi:MAG: LysE family transporter [Saprospiraceae bacterium]|nr:LysE family transporter [Saprospiraceae bacterium]